MGSVLKLKNESWMVSSKSGFLCICFLLRAFGNERNFSKMPFDCGWNGLGNWCFRPNSSATFLNRLFLNLNSLLFLL